MGLSDFSIERSATTRVSTNSLKSSWKKDMCSEVVLHHVDVSLVAG
ncbi:MAG: hypothetical protein KKF41_14680 [Actinobacteria bacterium]|nr:hypothetical protein [Actinomycetota bacterium]MBU2688821.1 hypothetical protein [Actinomycetota bacterium]